MKPILVKTLAAICVASIVSGFTYAHCRAKARHEANLVTMTFTQTVKKGDTLDGILENYFNQKNEGVTWMEWRAEQYKHNKHLYADKKHLWVGDKVTIVCKVVKPNC